MKVMVIFLLVMGLVVTAGAQERGWEQKWNEILTAARKEGKVVIKGVTDRNLRRKLPVAFRARFGIPLEYIGGRSSAIAARVRAERRARVYTIDVFLGGVTTIATILYKEKMLDPIRFPPMWAETK